MPETNWVAWMDDKKSDLLQKAEAYQRRMRLAHARRLEEEVTDLTLSLEAKAADVDSLASVFTKEHPSPRGKSDS